MKCNFLARILRASQNTPNIYKVNCFEEEPNIGRHFLFLRLWNLQRQEEENEEKVGVGNWIGIRHKPLVSSCCPQVFLRNLISLCMAFSCAPHISFVRTHVRQSSFAAVVSYCFYLCTHNVCHTAHRTSLCVLCYVC